MVSLSVLLSVLLCVLSPSVVGLLRGSCVFCWSVACVLCLLSVVSFVVLSCVFCACFWSVACVLWLLVFACLFACRPCSSLSVVFVRSFVSGRAAGR